MPRARRSGSQTAIHYAEFSPDVTERRSGHPDRHVGSRTMKAKDAARAICTITVERHFGREADLPRLAVEHGPSHNGLVPERPSLYRRLQQWFSLHPLVYGLVFALPFPTWFVLLQAEQGRLDEVRTWTYASLLFGFAVFAGFASRRWYR